jgi:lipopolysaccharide biosynthesis glycosyltransferase/Flp pilus assembly protein TadD
MDTPATVHDISSDEAEAKYLSLLDQAPGHTAALMALGEIARRRGDLAAALIRFAAAVASNPAQNWPEVRLADTLRDLSRFEEARAHYRAVLERSPGQADCLAGLGVTARRLGDLQSALAHFEAAAAIDPARPWFQLMIAEILRGLRRLDEAAERYRSLLQNSPVSLDALLGLGLIARERNDNAAAISYFEAARKAAPGNRRVLRQLILTLDESLRLEDAAAALGQMEAVVGPDDPELRVSKFAHYLKANQLDKADAILALWRRPEDVPDAAVAAVMHLHAARRRWPQVLAFFRERVVDKAWSGVFAGLTEPLMRATRATGQYAQMHSLLGQLSDRGGFGPAGETLRDQIAEEIGLLRMIDGRRPGDGDANDPTIADPCRSRRARFLANVLGGGKPALPKTSVFACADAGYLAPAIVCVSSLLRHNMALSQACAITVFCTDDILDIAAVAFAAIGSAFSTQIAIRSASPLVARASGLRDTRGVYSADLSLTRSVYYRIYAVGELIDEGAAGRALYLDADTCVIERLDDLLSFDLAGQPLGARRDDPTPAVRRATQLLGLDPGEYFNSGVLLFDLSHPELRPALEHTSAIAATEQHRLIHRDQSALNLAFRKRYAALPETYNHFVWPNIEASDIPAETVVLHFLSSPKPWDPMYRTRNCMHWLKEFADAGHIVGPEMMRRLLGLQYPRATGPAQTSVT